MTMHALYFYVGIKRSKNTSLEGHVFCISLIYFDETYKLKCYIMIKICKNNDCFTELIDYSNSKETSGTNL